MDRSFGFDWSRYCRSVIGGYLTVWWGATFLLSLAFLLWPDWQIIIALVWTVITFGMVVSLYMRSEQHGESHVTVDEPNGCVHLHWQIYDGEVTRGAIPDQWIEVTMAGLSGMSKSKRGYLLRGDGRYRLLVNNGRRVRVVKDESITEYEIPDAFAETEGNWWGLYCEKLIRKKRTNV